MSFKSRLKKLEQRRAEVSREPFRVIARSVVGATDLMKSSCTRTLNPDGQLWECVHLTGSGEDLSKDELEQWIASFPIEPLRAQIPNR